MVGDLAAVVDEIAYGVVLKEIKERARFFEISSMLNDYIKKDDIGSFGRWTATIILGNVV